MPTIPPRGVSKISLIYDNLKKIDDRLDKLFEIIPPEIMGRYQMRPFNLKEYQLELSGDTEV